MAPPLTVPVLVVDDNAAKRVALRAVLTPLGHSIVEAASGEAALRCLVEQNFAVILLDVRMPLMDGFETAKLIRQSRGSETTPIIFITAYGRDEILDIERCAESAVDFIFAPVPAEELRAKVSAFAKIFLQSTSLAASALAAQTAADELKAVNDRLAIIVRQDPLTGLGNRRAIEEDLELLEARVRRYGHSY